MLAFGDSLTEGLATEFNVEIARLATAMGAGLVDIASSMTDDMIAPDGLHLTAAGNRRLAQVCFEALRSRYER